jgi:hypothetical protein
MDESKIAKFSEYARLKNEAGAIKERLDELTPELLGEMLEIDGADTKVETLIGSFTIRKTKEWTYPLGIVNAEEAVKTAKKTAQKEGDATYEEKPGLSFRRKAV